MIVIEFSKPFMNHKSKHSNLASNNVSLIYRELRGIEFLSKFLLSESYEPKFAVRTNDASSCQFDVGPSFE